MPKKIKYSFTMCCRWNFKEEKFAKCCNKNSITDDCKKRKHTLGTENNWKNL